MDGGLDERLQDGDEGVDPLRFAVHQEGLLDVAPGLLEPPDRVPVGMPGETVRT